MAKRIKAVRASRTCCFVQSSVERDPTIFEVVRDAAGVSGFETIGAALSERDYAGTSTSTISEADVIVIEYSPHDPQVLIALGIAQALDKKTFCIYQANSIRENDVLLEMIGGNFKNLEIVPYEFREYNELFSRLDLLFRRNRSRSIGRQSPTRIELPFFIDWDMLEPIEIENLCQELLVQMGFRRVKWGESLGEIDLIAELPRKDPDDFEFRELWLVAMGLRNDPRRVLDMAMQDPEHFLYRTARYSENVIDSYRDKYVSLLVISPNEIDLSKYDNRLENYSRRVEVSSRLRIRIWDRMYLTSLVQKFPNIAYKYFSSEGRSQSKFRKSKDDLYRENVQLVDNLARTVKELNEEKDRRVRAERDAVWKDISFSAAHKLGNPIFAIETGLEPFVKRVREGRLDDAVNIANLLGSSVNKAKLVIEQFKSLAKSEQIDVLPTDLTAIINNQKAELTAQNIYCDVAAPDALMVVCDAEKISECLDELAMNSIRWMEKSGKPREFWKIEITAGEASDRALPSILERGTKYAVVNFKDNGAGVQIDQKSRIFDAFITHYEHGTGLGLALVRRIIDGHGGAIIEVGKPGEGADFEFYLPLANRVDTRLRVTKSGVENA